METTEIVGGATVILFALLGLFSAIARMTPNPRDDKWASKAWAFVNALGLRGGPTE